MGLTVLDAGVLIAFLDASDPHHIASRNALEAGRTRGDEFVLPASAYAEVLVGPLRRDPGSAAVVDAFVDAFPLPIAPATREIAAAAARLRAAHARLRLPDALVIATGTVLGADRIVTTDAGWPDIDTVVDLLGQ